MLDVFTPVMPRTDREVLVGWLDLQTVLRELLYQGETAICPLQQLEAIEKQALDLLKRNPDESLFSLFQSLADPSLSYCATHALLSAVVCELIAEKLGTAEPDRRVLFRAALAMNIGMARDHDSLAQQSTALLNDVQRKLIRKHPEYSLAILQSFGVTDEDQLDIVRWHHEPDESNGINRNLASRRLLRMADGFVAKMAARKTRLAMSPLSAAQSVDLGPGVRAAGSNCAAGQACRLPPADGHDENQHLQRNDQPGQPEAGFCLRHRCALRRSVAWILRTTVAADTASTAPWQSSQAARAHARRKLGRPRPRPLAGMSRL